MTGAKGLVGCGFFAALVAGGCGREQPPPRTPDYVPAEYHQYMRDGKVQPAGHPTLDYWVRVNVTLTVLKGPQTDFTLPYTLHSLAKAIRERPTQGVDQDVASWAAGVAGVLATRADVLTQLNDPGTLRRAREEVAAGRPNPLDALDRATLDWERDRDRLIAEGRALRDVLSGRHGRQFPPPQL